MCVCVCVCVCVCDEQCARRYEELLASSGLAAQQMAKTMTSSYGGSHATLSDADQVSRQSINSADLSKQKGTKTFISMRRKDFCNTTGTPVGRPPG